MSFLLMLALAAEPHIDPKDPGMLDGWQAFAQSCGAIYENPKEWEKYASEAKSQEDIVASMMVPYACAGLVRGVAETAAASPNYQYNGVRICVDPNTSIDALVRKAVEITREDEAKQYLTGTPTSLLIVTALARLSTCK